MSFEIIFDVGIIITAIMCIYLLWTKLRPTRISDKLWAKMHIDQAAVHSWWGERTFFASYTPYGIKQLDGEYCKRICNLNEDPEKLKKEIKENPHLHKLIKQNLLLNLKNYAKDYVYTPPPVIKSEKTDFEPMAADDTPF